jgi:succinoglycan biosynthesis protein ExoM
MGLLVSITVATCHRPEGLKRLIEGLNQQIFKRIDTPIIDVIVIDNDANKSALTYCDEVRHCFKWNLIYNVEVKSGVSHARNKGIASVSDQTDFVVIIDDDEVPVPEWLENLLIVQQRYDADIVTGPVLPYFSDNDTPQWIIQGKYFLPSRYNTGDNVSVAYTNNVLIRNSIIKNMNPAFEERFATNGGEDTYTFMKLKKAGYTLVWSDEAIVYEWIQKSRTNLNWILQRGYWGWSSYSLFEKDLYPSLKCQAIRLLKGILLLLAGVLYLPIAIFMDKVSFTNALLNIYRGMGTLSGLLGIQGKWRRSYQ